VLTALQELSLSISNGETPVIPSPLPCLKALRVAACDPFAAAAQLMGRGPHLTSLGLYSSCPGAGWAPATQQLGVLPVLQQLVLGMPLVSIWAAGPWLLQQPQLTSLGLTWQRWMHSSHDVQRVCLSRGVVRDGLPAVVTQLTRLQELRLAGPCTQQVLGWVTGLTQLSVLELQRVMGSYSDQAGTFPTNPTAWKVLSQMPMLCRLKVDYKLKLFGPLREAAPYLYQPKDYSDKWSIF
jgi:hypothetical protein